ncbi:SDR family oxidoreductase [Streptomyces sp. NPDC054834]
MPASTRRGLIDALVRPVNQPIFHRTTLQAQAVGVLSDRRPTPWHTPLACTKTLLSILPHHLGAASQTSTGAAINVTSLVTVGLPERTSYGAAKAALDFCTRAWAGEFAAEGITVNSVAPGPTETELFRGNNPPGSPGEARYLADVPAGRLAQPHSSGVPDWRAAPERLRGPVAGDAVDVRRPYLPLSERAALSRDGAWPPTQRPWPWPVRPSHISTSTEGIRHDVCIPGGEGRARDRGNQRHRRCRGAGAGRARRARAGGRA